jgi:hypothetical protein
MKIWNKARIKSIFILAGFEPVKQLANSLQAIQK